MDYLAFVLAIMEWVRKCIEDRDRESVEQYLNKPGLLVTVSVWRCLRKEGLRGRELREMTGDFLDELTSMEPVDIEDFVEDCLALGPAGPDAKHAVKFGGNTIEGTKGA